MNRGTSVLHSSLKRTSTTPFVCLRCQVNKSRTISSTFLIRKEEGRQEWAARAEEIRTGRRESMLTILESRGFVHALAGERTAIDKLMTDKRIGIYCGVDPTAASLHVGHMVTMMAMFWLYLYGFHTVSLLGGSTARIGDPTGRTTSRAEMTSAERKANIASMHYQLKKLWVNAENLGRKFGFVDTRHYHRELVNNATWWNKLAFLDVLKYMGRGMRLGPMLSRDTVKTKMESGDGMSFSEFCYPLMQSWDFWQLYDEKGIQMQLGGQDQFGNIVAGIDAVKFVAKTHPDPDIRAPETGIEEMKMPYGLTVPLLTTASGEKFGKSAGNAIWLDQQMTSVFDLYKFFVGTADADVERYLKLFTFLPLPKIQGLMDKHIHYPSQRLPQHTLAYEFVHLVHGEAAAKDAKAQHAAFYSKAQTLSSLTAAVSAQSGPVSGQETSPEPNNDQMKLYTATKADPAPKNPLSSNQNEKTRERGSFISPSLNPFAPAATAASNSIQKIVLPKSLVYAQPIARVLYSAGMVTSRSEGHRLAAAQGAYVGHQSGVNARHGKTQMSDQLTFTPAKLHDKNMMWTFVIRDEQPNKEGRGGEMEKSSEGEEGTLILRAGKWKVRVCRIVSDELFEKLGLEDPPGWAEFKAEDAMRRHEIELQEMKETATRGSTRRAMDKAIKEQQKLALDVLKDRGANRKQMYDAVWQTWQRAKNASKPKEKNEFGGDLKGEMNWSENTAEDGKGTKW